MNELNKTLKLALATEGLSISPSAFSKCARDAALHCLENGQIAPVNFVIQAALKLKGINADRVANWMTHAVPHDFDQQSKKFGKKSKEPHARRSAKEFAANNPDFYKWTPHNNCSGGKEDGSDKPNRHVKALKAATTEILKGNCQGLSDAEIKTIENVTSDLNSMAYGWHLVSGSGGKNDVKAHFVSGGLPSLGKKKK